MRRATASPLPLRLRPGTVIVVDDDASVRKALSRLLRAARYEVEALESAGAYLARTVGEPPACLLLDVRMPGMSGLDLQGAIASTPRALPIVFITGHGDDEGRQQALAAGAVAVLDKPFEPAELLRAIEQAMQRSLGAA